MTITEKQQNEIEKIEKFIPKEIEFHKKNTLITLLIENQGLYNVCFIKLNQTIPSLKNAIKQYEIELNATVNLTEKIKIIDEIIQDQIELKKQLIYLAQINMISVLQVFSNIFSHL